MDFSLSSEQQAIVDSIKGLMKYCNLITACCRRVGAIPATVSKFGRRDQGRF